MSLTYSPNTAIYDQALDAIRVLALDGQRLVFCAIRRCALASLEPIAQNCDARHLVRAYQRHAARLQAIAAWKYEVGRRDGDGRILVEAVDLAAPLQRDPADAGGNQCLAS